MTLTSLPSADWQYRAACIGEDPGLFFPVSAEDPSAGRAKRVCSGCEVRGDCLRFAPAAGEHGVWGGTTDDERRTAAQRERAHRMRETRRAAA
jgi:WhiB family transcriptional regulator, redox-sensing transcriptional regulator